MNSIILSGMAWASSIKDAITTRMREERGQDLVEYALLIGFIAVVAAIAFVAAPIEFDTFALRVKDCVSFNADCGDALP